MTISAAVAFQWSAPGKNFRGAPIFVRYPVVDPDKLRRVGSSGEAS